MLMKLTVMAVLLIFCYPPDLDPSHACKITSRQKHRIPQT